MTDTVAEERVRRSVVGVDRPLTRMVDCRLFSGHLQRAVRRNAGVPGGLAVLAVAPDPPSFAHLDDAAGMRDEISLITAGRLVGYLHYSDLVTRTSSGEFLVLAEGIGGVDRAIVLAVHLMEAAREPEMVPHQKPVTVSIGIAFQEPGATAELLASNATAAMYSARSEGGDRYQVYGERTDETAPAVTGTGIPQGSHRATVAVTPRSARSEADGSSGKPVHPGVGCRHLVGQAVVDGLGGGEETAPAGVVEHPRDRLTGHLGQASAERRPLIEVGRGQLLELPGVAPHLHARLDQAQSGMSRHHPMAAHSQHADGRSCGLAHARCPHRYAQQVDDVHEGQRRRQRPVGAVDLEMNRAITQGIQRHQLGSHPVGHLVVQATREQDDAELEQLLAHPGCRIAPSGRPQLAQPVGIGGSVGPDRP